MSATESLGTTQPSARTSRPSSGNVFPYDDQFRHRHIGPSNEDRAQMLRVLGYASLDALIDAAVPAAIRLTRPLDLPAVRSEFEALKDLKAIAAQNEVFRSFIGMGYHDCI